LPPASVAGRVLDIGCGPDRHSLWLQESVFDVVAIDISPLAVRVAKAREHALLAEGWIQEN